MEAGDIETRDGRFAAFNLDHPSSQDHDLVAQHRSPALTLAASPPVMGRKAEVQRLQLEKLMGPEGEYARSMSFSHAMTSCY